MKGSRLKNIREEKGLTQAQLAEKIGLEITGDMISKYENGRAEPNDVTLFAICETLEISADYLIGLTNKKCLPKDDSFCLPPSLNLDKYPDLYCYALYLAQNELNASQKALLYGFDMLDDEKQQLVLNLVDTLKNDNKP